MWGTGLLNGLRITMRNMIRGPITVQYPYEKLPMFERSRWAVEPILDESGEHKCTACLNCVKVCPESTSMTNPPSALCGRQPRDSFVSASAVTYFGFPHSIAIPLR